MSTSILPRLKECVEIVSEELKADIFLYNAEISTSNADELIQTVIDQRSKKENVALILTTNGGDPDSAFRIARFLQDRYKKFILFIFGRCKSAGTLIAVGATEIVMSDLSELGPLDMQVLKDDDIIRKSSGLDLHQALTVLRKQGLEMFQHYFFVTNISSGGIITTKTSADIASSMVVGLLSPIANQIDPLRLGAVYRSMDVAYEYGVRLNPARKNAIRKLVSNYPSHGFVIDRKEAKELFGSVRSPSESESLLEEILNEYHDCARTPLQSEKCIFSLNDDIIDEEIEDEDPKDREPESEKSENAGLGDEKNEERCAENEYTENKTFQSDQSVQEGALQTDYSSSQ